MAKRRILLVNEGTTPARTTVTFLRESGGTVQRTCTVAASSRATIHAGSIPELVNQAFSTIVEADAPIVAERAMYFGTGWAGGHESAGVSDPATRWFHAEGATGPTFSTYFLITNPNLGPMNVLMHFLTDAGQQVDLHFAMQGLTRRTVSAADVSPMLANASFATAIDSDQPIVSERAMYWSSTAGGPWVEAHNSFGLPTTATRWGTAAGRVGGPREYQTYVLVANPSSTSTANLTATFMRSDGATVTRTMTLGPARRLNIACHDIPELADAEFGVVVTSTNGIPIAVERATYWNANGVIWAAGTNVTATPIP